MAGTLDDEQVPVDATITLRPIGNPLPLGFIALAGGTLLLSALQLGWLDAGLEREVMLMIVSFVVPLEALAAVLAFLARDGVVGTSMALLSGMWLAIVLSALTAADPAASNDALGVMLVFVAVALLAPVSVGVGAKLVPTAVLALTALRVGLSGIHELTEGGAWETAAGIAGLVLSALALYAVLALMLEDARRHEVLPIGRRGRGEAHLEERLEEIEHEAGVREQL